MSRGKRRKTKRVIVALGFSLFLALAGSFVFLGAEHPDPAWHTLEYAQAPRITGPLQRSTANPRYFTNATGKAIYLTGSHVWNNLQDIEPPFRTDATGRMIEPGTESISKFDFPSYLNFLAKENHNFIRLWTWEQVAWVPWLESEPTIEPLAYARIESGKALDGKPQFDLAQFDQSYFDRLRSRVSAAGDRGIYVSVMLFQGWSIENKEKSGKKPWRGHPFHRANNVNGVDGDPNGDEQAIEAQTLQIPSLTTLQESYVRKVVATLNDLDNVLWEISNESNAASNQWQYHMIDFVKRCEAELPKQHPVGMTFCFPGGENADLFNSSADWISPDSTWGADYRENPPAADGRKVIVSDTDHLFGVGGDRVWVWKSFTRGLNPIFMDPIEMPQWESARRAMGLTLFYANRMNLSAMRPRGDLTSSGYCLANPGEEYLVYIPLEVPSLESRRFVHRFKQQLRNLRRLFATTVSLDLSSAPVAFQTEWLNPSSGELVAGASVMGGTKLLLTAPFKGDAVLYLRKSPELRVPGQPIDTETSRIGGYQTGQFSPVRSLAA